MLPTRNPSLFFTLFYLWSTVAVFASPFPAGNRYKHSSSASAATPHEVNIYLTIRAKGSSAEHWLLRIGDIYIHAPYSPFVDSSHLSVQKDTLENIYPPLEHISLGKASFRDVDQEEEFIDTMVYTKEALGLGVPLDPEEKVSEGQGIILQMRKGWLEKGGNCMDFFMQGMRYLNQHGVFQDPKVMEKAQKVFRARYHDVAKTVFGLDLQP